jgi:outer membrane protein assembly factor BamB
MNMRMTALLAGLGLVCVFPVGAADWTQFRGPGGTSVSDETDVPVKWSTTEGLCWKAELPGRGLSNPVIAAGRVYVTASSGYREKWLHVLCFDEKTGAKLWERRFNATGNTGCHPKTCMAAPSPVTDGKHVFALFATADLAALDSDGNLLWYRSLVGDYPTISNQVGMAASLTLYRDTLIVPMENVGESFLAGLDKMTGKNRWKVKRPQDINWVSPIVVDAPDKAAVVFPNGKEFTALDPETGKIRWTFNAEGASNIQSPTAGSGLLFVPGQKFYALRPGSDGTTPEVLWEKGKLASAYACPVYYKDHVYALTSVGVTCVKAADGEEVWKQRIDGPFVATPVLADGKLYVVNEKGLTTVLQLGPEPKVLAKNDLKDTFLATPAISGGAIYLRSDGYLYGIGAKKEK